MLHGGTQGLQVWPTGGFQRPACHAFQRPACMASSIMDPLASTDVGEDIFMFRERIPPVRIWANRTQPLWLLVSHRGCIFIPQVLHITLRAKEFCTSLPNSVPSNLGWLTLDDAGLQPGGIPQPKRASAGARGLPTSYCDCRPFHNLSMVFASIWATRWTAMLCQSFARA